MFAQLRRPLVLVIAASLVLAVTACSAPASQPSPGATTGSDGSTEGEPSPSATGTEGKVDSLPLFEGVTDSAPQGWVAGACEALSFATPPGWFPMQTQEFDLAYDNGQNWALSVTDDVSTRSIPQIISVWCTPEKATTSAEWDGDIGDLEGAEWSRLDVEGALYSAVVVRPRVDTVTDGTPSVPGDIFTAEIRILTDDGVFYGVNFILPASDTSYEMVRQVASSIDIGWSGTTRTEP